MVTSPKLFKCQTKLFMQVLSHNLVGGKCKHFTWHNPSLLYLVLSSRGFWQLHLLFYVEVKATWVYSYWIKTRFSMDFGPVGILTLYWIHLHQAVVLSKLPGCYSKRVNEHPNFNSVILMHASRFHICFYS